MAVTALIAIWAVTAFGAIDNYTYTVDGRFQIAPGEVRTDGNRLATTNEVIAVSNAFVAADDLLRASTNALNTRMGNSEAATNNLNTRVNANSAATNALNTRMGTVETATGALHTAVGALQGATNDLNTRMGNAETATGSLHTAVGLLNAATNAINIRVGNTESATNNLAARVVVLEGGTIEKFPGDTLTVAGKVYQWSNTVWDAAVCISEIMCKRYLGVAVGTNSTTFGILTLGKMTVNGTSLSPGAGIYVDAVAGEWTQTVPTNSGYIIRLVGYATKTNEIYVKPDGIWAEIE